MLFRTYQSYLNLFIAKEGVSILEYFSKITNQHSFLWDVKKKDIKFNYFKFFISRRVKWRKILSNLYFYMVMKLRQKFCNKHLTLLKQWTRDILFTIELQERTKTNRIKCDKKLYFSFICVVATTHTHTRTEKGKTYFLYGGL